MKNQISRRVDLAHARRQMTCSIMIAATIIMMPSWIAPASSQEIRIARQTEDGSRASNGAGDAQLCARNYHASLSTIKKSAGAKLIDAARQVRKGRPDLPGYWLFWNPKRAAVRRKLARIGNPANAIVIEDRMCARSVLGRGGRIRCLKWVPKPKNYRPRPVVEPSAEWQEPATSEAERTLLRRLTPVVRSRGAVQELQRSGRLYELTRRVGGELIGYLDQTERPTICTGAQAMLDFYERQLRPLENRFGDAEDLIQKTQTLSRKLAGNAHAAWSKPKSAADSAAGEDSSGDRAVDASENMPQAVRPLPTEWQEASEKALVQLTAGVMLPRRHLGYIKAEDAFFDRLIRAREAMSSASATEAPAHVRSAVFAAFRGLEMSYYAGLRREQVQTYRKALFGVIDAIRKQHGELCTCSQ